MRTLLFSVLLAFGLFAQAQSLWFEAGVGYIEQEATVYAAAPKVGLRGALPLGAAQDASPELFAALAWREGLIADAGVWFPLAPGITDPFGLRSYLGAGLSYVRGDFGLALSAAASYELSRNLALSFSYTHRPLVFPRLAQAFDASIGLRWSLEP
ncbi:MAG: hypothetical protein M3511_12845 [Deinococcota bacterium]|jgi:hypothetical protein|nr:hypothetical protein [Deinococcota bacterium]